MAIIEHDGHLLLIERASRRGDRWSGHMAFPGGMREERDADLRATAQRETMEEVGVDLSAAKFLRRQPPLLSASHDNIKPLVIEPYVYTWPGDRPKLRGSDEVASTLWVPTEFLRDRGNRGTMTYRKRGIPMPFPCYRFGGKVIWGLTLRMIDDLIARG